MLTILSFLSRAAGTLGILVQLMPDVLALVSIILKGISNKKIDKGILTDKIEKDKERIRNALNEPDPQKRSELLNDVFSN